MLLGSNYVLNKCKKKDCTQIYPWIHQYTNNMSADDMTSSVKFPDINPEDLQEDAQLSMIAGDFLECESSSRYLDLNSFMNGPTLRQSTVKIRNQCFSMSTIAYFSHAQKRNNIAFKDD